MKTVFFNGSVIIGPVGVRLRELLGSDWIRWYVGVCDWAVTTGRIDSFMGAHGCDITGRVLQIESDVRWDGQPGALLGALFDCKVIEVVNGGLFLNEHFFFLREDS